MKSTLIHSVRPAGTLSVRRPMPEWIAPQLASPTGTVPAGDDWIHETKYDGYRLLAFSSKAGIYLMSRNRKDWTPKFRSIRKSLEKIDTNVILDGELCVMDKEGRSSFELLQKSFKGEVEAFYQYYIFDVLYLDQWDLRKVPLIERKSLLRKFLEGLELNNVHFSDHVAGQGPKVLEGATALGWEGIISKQQFAPYLSGRTASWQKVKVIKTDDFAVIGFTPSKGATISTPASIGSLLLGYRKGNEWIYCGKVGTGFSMQDRAALFELLSRDIKKKHTPIDKLNGAVWVKPRLVAQVSFTEWTSGGKLRHPSFLGLREDKNARDVVTTAHG